MPRCVSGANAPMVRWGSPARCRPTVGGSQRHAGMQIERAPGDARIHGGKTMSFDFGATTWPGWCFGTFWNHGFCLKTFPFSIGVVHNPNNWRTHIFQRGWNHQTETLKVAPFSPFSYTLSSFLSLYAFPPWKFNSREISKLKAGCFAGKQIQRFFSRFSSASFVEAFLRDPRFFLGGTNRHSPPQATSNLGWRFSIFPLPRP